MKRQGFGWLAALALAVFWVSGCASMEAGIRLGEAQTAELPAADVVVDKGLDKIATPVALGADGRIAFVGVDWNIRTSDRLGEDVVALTDDAAIPTADGGGDVRLYRFPTWSQNGEVAYVQLNLGGADEGQRRIIVSPGTGGVSRTVYESDSDYPFYLYWAPDGQQVAFLSSAEGTPGMALQVTAGAVSTVVERGQPFYWAWSPDSREVFAHVGGASPANPDARLAQLTVGDPALQTDLPVSTAFFQAPDYSPDGEWVIYATQASRSTVGELVLRELASGDETVLTTFSGGIAFDWAPVGDSIAFVTGQYASFGDSDGGSQPILFGELSFVDVSDRDNPVVVATDVNHATTFYWSPDGTRVVFFEPYYAPLPDFEDVVFRDVAGAGQGGEEIVRFVSMRVAAAADGSIETIVDFRPTALFVDTVMPYFAQYQRSTTIWSPGGDYLVISALTGRDAFPNVAVVAATPGAAPQAIGAGYLGFWSWATTAGP